MSPIRVGFIGLGKPVTGLPLQGAWGVVAHLPGLLHQKDTYQIVALCNSSIESARASIAGHNLPASTKAYDNPTELANDPDVDLVVVSVFIGKHYMLAKPALEAAKMVYVEAPLAASVAEAEELAALAKLKGVRTMVGTQARSSAAIAKARELIASGEIGEVVSSTVMARMAGHTAFGKFPIGAKIALDLEGPGNSLLIGFNHFYDVHQQVLGPIKTYSALIEHKGGPRPLVDTAGNVVDHYQPTAPDHIFFQGKLNSGALASIAWRPNLAPADRTAPNLSDHGHLRWVITGSTGELDITTPDIMWQMTGSSVKLHLTKNGATSEVNVPKEFGDEMSILAENTAAQYAAFAKGDKERYADFEDAAEAARFMEELRGVARKQLVKQD